MTQYLGIDCGSVSLNLALLVDGTARPVTVYRRTRGRPLSELSIAIDEMIGSCGGDVPIDGLVVTGSGRGLLSRVMNAGTVNEISAHATGAYWTNPAVRTVIEVGGQDSKFMLLEPPLHGEVPRISVFRMNEICAAGTGAFLDEQSERLGIDVKAFGPLALQSSNPAPIAGRCAVFAKTDMIHQAQEGTPIPDILLGLAFALVRNYAATLIKGETLHPPVFLQGGVMSNSAVVHAFRLLLGLEEDRIVIPSHFKVMGAIGCAVLAARDRSPQRTTLFRLRELVTSGQRRAAPRSCLPRLAAGGDREFVWPSQRLATESAEPPLIMALDVGSVSVKGVVIDSHGRIVRSDYRLSRSRTLEAVGQLLEALGSDGCVPEVMAVTGSGRYLVGRLLDAELIVDEITAQSTAALNHCSQVETVVEIGGQDSKWIALENGFVKDFQMNRVCAAGTGSFLMAQADRLDLEIGSQFSDAAFDSEAPADLGNRCTVFMESDLVHHQNNGASRRDLAAGVCVSIVHNYLERVANNKLLRGKVLFLGGVAGTPAVKAAFEQQTGLAFETPDFFNVSGALGAALKARDKLSRGEITPGKRANAVLRNDEIRRGQFTCKGCSNRCRVARYTTQGRTVFHGGLCDRWEAEERSDTRGWESDPFGLRVKLLEDVADHRGPVHDRVWGVVRSPQFYEWFPFWRSFLHELGVSLIVAPANDRSRFQSGIRFLRVETCFPMKAMAGQIDHLVSSGVKTIFHPVVLNERAASNKGPLVEYCPYIQASSMFFKDAFAVDWVEPTISFAVDSDAFARESLRLAAWLGSSRKRALQAMDKGMEAMEQYRARLRSEGEQFLGSLDSGERGLVVLGKPYHTADRFLNMNLSGVFQRLSIRALPSDLYPLDDEGDWPDVYWKYQGNMIRVVREIRRDPRLFPVLITFFGCGPDPFTIRHIQDELQGKPLLMLEMDEHSSRAGLVTRVEAFLEQIAAMDRKRRQEAASVHSRQSGISDPGCGPSLNLVRHEQPQEGAMLAQTDDKAEQRVAGKGCHRLAIPDILFLPYMGDHSYGLAAAARSAGIDARVLPPPDEESERLGRAYIVGGECHPYVLVLGDYLKLARQEPDRPGAKALFYMIGPSACRLGQFSRYMEKIRLELGLNIGLVSEVDEALTAFGISEFGRQRVNLRGWESLHAFDALLRVYLHFRPYATNRKHLDALYVQCRDIICEALSEGRLRQGIEEALHKLHGVAVEHVSPRPLVSVTGDYYTRVVAYANNDAFREIEALGGTVWPPPTFSDCLKMATLRDLRWNLLNRQTGQAAIKAVTYVLQTFSEFKVRNTPALRNTVTEPLDLLGSTMWRRASLHAPTRLPAGITAPIATALNHLDLGANGVLNLMTLNCSYGTVVTAALARAVKQRPGIPMLTLIYDGLKKTNEKTRLEAFMEQVTDHFRGQRGQTEPKGKFFGFQIHCPK